jgi:hypothetical protein
MGKRVFRVVLIKPSHYDDDGYVIQWHRSVIPSNSLASLHALVAQCAEGHTLGPDVDIAVEAYDECNTVIDVRGIMRRMQADVGGFVGLVGVQSNQYPRALDLARELRAAGIAVVIGGFHVSGCLSMLPKLTPELEEALALGVTLYAGEAEGRLDALLRDIDAGRAKPIYNHLDDLPNLAGAVPPLLPRDVITRGIAHYTSFDAGRGCPFQCSFCTIINVQGRKSRRRTPDDVEAIVRANAAQGITRFFVTDDNFARNKDWEPILDRLISLREQGLNIRLILQVDTLCHRIPGFIEKSVRAGCRSVFIGLESINPESLMGAKKRQNKIWEYRDMLLEWKRRGVMTWCGYILGFPADTPESIARDIAIIQRELPVDFLEFFVLTPLPGSEDHKVLHQRGVAMDPDLNGYDAEHVTTAHPIMSEKTWTRAYHDAWAHYYTDAHIETVLRRAVATGLKPKRILEMMIVFAGAVPIEGIHPLQLGVLRRKVRTQRRHGMKREHPLLFHPREVWNGIRALIRWGRLSLRYARIMRRVVADPAAKDYRDAALQPVEAEARDASELMRTHAAKIPHTHGAPANTPASAAARAAAV